jgi:hypothetical protein
MIHAGKALIQAKYTITSQTHSRSWTKGASASKADHAAVFAFIKENS